MKKKLFILFLAALIGFTALPRQKAWGSVRQEGDTWIVSNAEGFAPIINGNRNAARDEARRSAHRDALEKALGAVVTGITEMQNFEVVRDKVFSQTQGLVRRFDIVHEKVEDDMLTIVGTARVAVAALDGVLGPAVLDAIGNPRVMALIDERVGDHTPFLSTTEGMVLGVFEKAGYLLVNPDQARALLNIDPSVAYNDPSALMDAARTLNADVIILGRAYGSAFTQQRISGQRIFGVRSTVQLKAVLTKTAYQLGSQVIEKRTQGFSVEDGVIKGFQAAGPEAASSIVHKVAYALVSGSIGGVPGMTVKVRISGVSFTKSESILEGLRGLAGSSGGVYERGFSDGVFEVDVVSERTLRNVASFLSESGINVKGIDGQIINGEVGEAPAASSPGEPAQTGVTVTVKITDVPSFREASAIEDSLREMIGQGEIETGYRDGVLEVKIISDKTGREIASFLSENDIEITGSTAQSIEGKVSGTRRTGLW